MQGFLIVFIGAGLGGSLRYAVNLVGPRWFGLEFPWGTLIINVLGSTVMGVIAAWFATRASAPWSGDGRLFAMTGILGGFTTFSAFSLDAVTLWERGSPAAAAAYVTASVAVSIAGLLGGLAIVRALA